MKQLDRVSLSTFVSRLQGRCFNPRSVTDVHCGCVLWRTLSIRRGVLEVPRVARSSRLPLDWIFDMATCRFRVQEVFARAT